MMGIMQVFHVRSVNVPVNSLHAQSRSIQYMSLSLDLKYGCEPRISGAKTNIISAHTTAYRAKPQSSQVYR